MRKKNTESLREILGQVLKQNRLDEKLYETRVIKSWPEVLGEHIVQYTSDISINKGTLYVSLTSAVLRHELFLTRSKIIESLNKHVGAPVVKEIIFR